MKRNEFKFENYNANPFKKRTGDCVLRAMSVGLNQDYFQTLDEMVEVTKKTGYYMSYKDGYKAYLKSKGYEMQKMPKKSNGKRYTVKEFIEEIVNPKKNYIIKLANHVTCIEKGTLIDIWNCSSMSVGNYWEV